MNYQEYCKTIKGVVIPKTLVFDIGYLWFHHDRLPLKLISLGNTSTPVINVPSRALNSYGKMVSVTDISKNAFAGNGFLTDIIIPSSIWSLPEEAFSGCTHLKNITIPKTIKRIPAKTFDGCSNLENVYYEGSLEDWENMDIAFERYEIDFGGNIPGTPIRVITDERIVYIPGNDALRKATIHFNCDLKQLETEYRDDNNNYNKNAEYKIYPE